MYFTRRDGVTITEIYQLPTKKLLNKLKEKASGSKSIHAHASFSLDQIKKMGAKKVK